MILRFLMLDLHNHIFLFYSKIKNLVPNERKPISNIRQKINNSIQKGKKNNCSFINVHSNILIFHNEIILLHFI